MISFTTLKLNLLLAQFAIVSLFACLHCSSGSANPQTEKDQWRFGDKEQVGEITTPLIDESSGLACSGNHPKHFWTHNDGGSFKGLFLLNETGQLRATLSFPANVPFRDWEDMAQVTIEEASYLIVGDFGDNLSKNKTCRLYVLPEPTGNLSAEKVTEWSVSNVATIEFKYAAGPRNCEAMGVDGQAGRVYFVSKRGAIAMSNESTTLHWIPLQTESTKQPLVATALPFALNRRLVTGMSISPDEKLAVIRSYSSAYLYRRESAESWADRFAKLPDSSTLLPLQRQGESIAFAGDGRSIYLTSEGTKRPFWKIDLQLEKSTVGDK